MSDDSPTPARDPREITWPYAHPLSVEIEAHDEKLRVLILREPLGDEVIKYGLLEGLDASQFFPLVAKLGAVPEGTLRKLPARDLLSLGTVLSRFFQWAALPPA